MSSAPTYTSPDASPDTETVAEPVVTEAREPLLSESYVCVHTKVISKDRLSLARVDWLKRDTSGTSTRVRRSRPVLAAML